MMYTLYIVFRRLFTSSIFDHFFQRDWINFNCIFLDANTISFGQDTQVGPGVHFYAADHPVDPQQRRTFIETSSPITVGDNVWIGGGSILCPGVTIGDNTVIGAGSVVVKDIPANVVAVGNPCKAIKKI